MEQFLSKTLVAKKVARLLIRSGGATIRSGTTWSNGDPADGYGDPDEYADESKS